MSEVGPDILEKVALDLRRRYALRPRQRIDEIQLRASGSGREECC
jgi:hypothetical protein